MRINVVVDEVGDDHFASLNYPQAVAHYDELVKKNGKKIDEANLPTEGFTRIDGDFYLIKDADGHPIARILEIDLGEKK